MVANVFLGLVAMGEFGWWGFKLEGCMSKEWLS